MKKILEIVNQTEQKQQKLLQNQEFRQFLDSVLLGILYGQQYLKEKNYTVNRITNIELPEQQICKKGTLLLDLDETLMTTKVSYQNAEYQIQLEETVINFSIRPFAREMIQILSQYYEILIFTASKIEYAAKVVECIDPQHQFISAILDRAYCYKTENGVLIKDLRIITNRNLDQMLIVDNSALSFSFQPQNGIPVSSWLGDQKDRELQTLTIYLSQLSQSNNLRQANYDNLKFPKLMEMYTKIHC